MDPTVTRAPLPAAPIGNRDVSLRVRTVVAATSLVVSPILLTAAFAVVPTVAADRVALAVIAEHGTGWYLFGLLLVLSYLLLVPATLGLVHLAHARTPLWADVGGGLAVLGAITAVADARLVFLMGQMATPKADRGQMVALLERLGNDAGGSLPFIVGALALVAGTVVLAMALRRNAVPRWVCVALGAGIAGHTAAFVLTSRPALVATSVLLVVGYGGAAVHLLRTARRAS